MYAPPWARDEASRSAGDAGLAAVDRALNASDEFRRTLPPAAPLQSSRRWREPAPFDGDIAAKHLRERPSLDPVNIAPPPLSERGSVGVLARVGGAVGLAALAAFFVVGAVPQQFTPRVVAADRVGLPERPAPAAEPVALAERFAAVPAAMAAVEPPMVTQAVSATVAAPVAVPPPAAPPPSVLRTLDREELAMLLKRSEELITQGDIASARLMLTRAAEAGDARAALALGATFDKDVLRKLGVLGVSGDATQAKAWYAKAAESGSGEATRRLEIMAQSR